MKAFEEMKKIPGLKILRVGMDGFVGVIKHKNFIGSIIVSWGAGWEHISVSHKNLHYLPSWNDMCAFKDMFWNEDEVVVQYHPAKKDYVDDLENCLHLWRPMNETMPTPPKWLVGIGGKNE